MLTSLHIKNFRTFRDFKIGPLKRVNLIAGQNDSGKTAVLEAIYVMLTPNELPQRLPNLLRVQPRNTQPEEVFWPWLFYNRDSHSDLEVRAATEESPEIGVAIRSVERGQQAPPAGFKPFVAWSHYQAYITIGRKDLNLKATVFSTYPSDPVQNAIDYNRVILKRQKPRVQNMMREIEPRLEAIEPLQTGHQAPLIFADVGLKEMIPVTQMGQGFNRLLDIYSEAMASEAKVLLIDEIENGIHHSVLPVVWKGLAVAAREVGIQIFATTHSLECIAAAHAVFKDSPEYDFALHRLQRVKGDVEAITHDRDMVEAAMKTDLEIR